MPALAGPALFCMLIAMSYFLSQICLCFYPCFSGFTLTAMASAITTLASEEVERVEGGGGVGRGVAGRGR